MICACATGSPKSPQHTLDTIYQAGSEYGPVSTFLIIRYNTMDKITSVIARSGARSSTASDDGISYSRKSSQGRVPGRMAQRRPERSH